MRLLRRGIVMDEEKLIAFYGRYCGACHGFTGTVTDLARDLRKELRRSRYDKFVQFIATYSFGKDFENYEAGYKALGAIALAN